MCFTAALTAAEMLQIGAAVVSGVMQMQQADNAAARAAQQARDEQAAALAETKAQYAETNRKQAEAQLDQMVEESAAIRKANEQLGTLRATETALSDSSLGTIFFEEGYGQALSYSQITTNGKREIAALESEKYASEQSYINRVTQANNQAENLIAESNARRTGAILGALGSGLNVYAGAEARGQILKTIETGGKPAVAAAVPKV
jgi:hypothetical protein